VINPIRRASTQRAARLDAVDALRLAGHRKKEIKPMFEQWHRHSGPEFKAYMKKWCNLNYKYLDALGTR